VVPIAATMLSFKLITHGMNLLRCVIRMEEITIRKVTRDEGLFVYFVGLKDFWKMMIVVVEVVLAVVTVVMVIWNTKISGSFEAETWRQKALLSCRAAISQKDNHIRRITVPNEVIFAVNGAVIWTDVDRKSSLSL